MIYTLHTWAHIYIDKAEKNPPPFTARHGFSLGTMRAILVYFVLLSFHIFNPFMMEILSILGPFDVTSALQYGLISIALTKLRKIPLLLL